MFKLTKKCYFFKKIIIGCFKAATRAAFDLSWSGQLKHSELNNVFHTIDTNAKCSGWRIFVIYKFLV